MKQIKELKKILLVDKQKIMNKGSSQDDYCLQKDELSDVLDEANANIQASQMLRFRNREVFYLKKIHKALQQIEDNTYGLCDSCDEQIGYERLTARPTAQECITCKEEAELIEKNNFHQKKSKSLGKTMAEI